MVSILPGPDRQDQFIDITYVDKGGMGEIYKGEDVVNNRSVAIKVITLTDEVESQLLREEAHIALALDHPNIVKTYFFGEFSDSIGTHMYTVMEYCEKGNLRRILKNMSMMIPIEIIIQYFHEILSGLQSAHQKIIHRDLKPENILIGDDGSLKICDFGIAKYVNMQTRTHTFKGAGSLPYMAPECWTMDSNTFGMDIYSMGIIFFEIMTLKMPFNGPTLLDFQNQHLHSPLPAINKYRNDVPIVLAAIIKKMTNKNSRERYNNAGEVVEALNALGRSQNRKFNLEPLLKNVHEIVSKQAEEQLAKQRNEVEAVNRNSSLNYSIRSLFDQFETIIGEVNESLQESKIECKKMIVESNAYASTFLINFMGKRAVIEFFNDNLVEYPNQQREKHNDWQKRHNGFVMEPYIPDFIETDSVILTGRAVFRTSKSGKIPGYNLVLRKDHKEDVHGDWYVCKFIDNSWSSASVNYFYALETPEFFQEYDIARRRTMHVRQGSIFGLNEDVIVEFLQFMATFPND